MKVALWMSSPRGVAVHDSIVASGHHVSVVVVPNSNAGLVRSLSPRLGETLHVWATQSLNDLRFLLEESRTDVGIVAGFPRKIPMKIAASTPMGLINLHGGPLPQFRGGSPLAWQIIQGRKRIGVSLHKVVESLDAGPILANGEFELSPNEGIREAKLKSDQVFVKLVQGFLDDPERMLAGAKIQEEGAARYWHQRHYEDAEIDWKRMPAETVVNLIRATAPDYGGAFTFLGNQRVRIFRARLSVPPVCGTPGRVVRMKTNAQPLVVCATDGVVLEEYAIDGRSNVNEGLVNGARVISSEPAASGR